MILWVDIETTGLDPITDHILEVALVLTTDDLQPIHHTEVLIKPAIPTNALPMDQIVSDMHTKNGLLDDVEYGLSLYEARTLLLRWLHDIGVEKGDLPMAGSTVSFDRSFLKVHLPAVEEWFHYRNIDVSTVKELAKRWGAELPTRNGEAAHRALADIQASLDELRHYRDTGFLSTTLVSEEVSGGY